LKQLQTPHHRREKRSSQPTYEDLKLVYLSSEVAGGTGSQPTYEDLKQEAVTYYSCECSHSSQPTYEDLKQVTLRLPVNQAREFAAYLRGFETLVGRRTWWAARYRSQPTYEDLKLRRRGVRSGLPTCSQPTYEDLKPYREEAKPFLRLRSQPTYEDLKPGRMPGRTYSVRGSQPTYEDLKHPGPGSGSSF